MPGRIGVIGASGFLGSNISRHGRAVGLEIQPIAIERFDRRPPVPLPSALAAWRNAHAAAFNRLCDSLQGFDVIIQAAGIAAPGARDRSALFAANALLPAVVAAAANVAGVTRMVHISTAAVQGRLDPLDESDRHLPLTPYAASKAEAESFFFDPSTHRQRPPETIVYRPTSVQGSTQKSTQALARLLSHLPLAPVGGNGSSPLPLSLIENVAAGVVFAAQMPNPPAIVLQPDERVTSLLLLTIFGARHIIHLPPIVVDSILYPLATITAGPRFTARLRWIELLLKGQRIHAGRLETAGYVAPVDYQGWTTLVTNMRTDALLAASSSRAKSFA